MSTRNRQIKRVLIDYAENGTGDIDRVIGADTTRTR